MKNKTQTIVITLVVITMLSGCVAKRMYNAGQEAQIAGDWDKAIYFYTLALKDDPANINYKIQLERAKKKASRVHLQKAELLILQEKESEAFREYKLAIDLDPENRNAIFAFKEAREKYRKKLESERDQRRSAIKELSEKGIPRLQLKSPDKVTLDFQNKRVKEIYTAMAKLAGINLFFEETLKDRITSFSVKDVTFIEALETFAMANRNFFKIINDTTIFVIPDTMQLRKDYESIVMRVFFLENMPAKLARDYIRTIVGITRFIHSDDLNAVIIRGTPGQVAAAEKLVRILDRPKAEVLIDVEIMEVSRSDLNNIGLLFGGDYKVTQSTQSLVIDKEAGTVEVAGNNLSFAEISELGNQNLFLTIPSLTMNFLEQDSDTRLVAKPQLRITDKEKAKLHIGESVPVRSTTFNPTQTIGGNVVPIDSYTYRDIGIKLEFEPMVHNSKELTLKLMIEISSKLFENQAGLPTFGQKNIVSVIRLQDGETNMLAGLIKEDEKTTITGIPGLSSVPLLGKLFSNDSSDRKTLDTVITITPYIIRSSEITEDDLRGIAIGTESNIGLSLSDIFNNKSEDGKSMLIDNKKIDELIKDETIPPDVPAGERTRETEPQELRLQEGPPEMPLPLRPGRPYLDMDMVPGPAAQVTIEPAEISTVVDSSFTVQIVVRNGRNVAHAPFYLIFDPSYLEVLSVTEGGFLSQDQKQVSFLHSENNSTGEIRVGLSRLGAKEGISGDGVLAVITFRTKEKGKTYLSFTNCSLKDPLAQNMPVEFIPSEINID